MDDYISRDTTIEKIRFEGIYGDGYSDEELENDVVDMIESIPAADVKPVVRGSWVNNQELTRFACSSKGMYQCSECKQWINVFQMSGEMNYCPNCGADMRERDQQCNEERCPMKHDRLHQCGGINCPYRTTD